MTSGSHSRRAGRPHIGSPTICGGRATE